MILGDIARALGQLSDPRFRRVFFLGIGLTFALLAGAYVAIFWIVSALSPAALSLPWLGEVAWLDDLLSWGSLALMLGLSVFLMVPVASAVISFFLDDVAQAVEDRHYPDLPPVPRQPWTEALRDTFGFLGVLILANAVALVAYVIFPFAAIFIFYALNGFLLGREYFQIAAMRREGRAGARRLRRKHVVPIWIAGCLMALPLTVPLANLLVPILGAATFTHLYHRLRG